MSPSPCITCKQSYIYRMPSQHIYIVYWHGEQLHPATLFICFQPRDSPCFCCAEVLNFLKSHDDAMAWSPFPHYWSFVGESTSDRSIPLAKGKWSYVFLFFFVWAGCWTNNRFAGDSRRHALMWRHYNVKSCRVSESIPVYIYTYIFIYATFNFVVHLLLDIGISLRAATLLCDNNLIMD